MPPILESSNRALAVNALSDYFSTDGEDRPRYTGSRFERFGGGGDQPGSWGRFTAEDLVAVSMLSVDIPGLAALRILGELDPAHVLQLSNRLRRLPIDVELVDAPDEYLTLGDELWQLLMLNRGIGSTKASKLLARKRPRLFPVFDSVVRLQFGFINSRDFFIALRAELRRDDRAMWRHLATIRAEAGIGDDIGILRCFDVLIWMAGTGRVPALRHPRGTAPAEAGAAPEDAATFEHASAANPAGRVWRSGAGCRSRPS